MSKEQLNILAILLYWYPYSGPMTPIYSSVFRDLKAKGHRITIISSFPHFRYGGNETWDDFRGKLFEKTTWEGSDLLRTWVLSPIFKKSKWALWFRALNYISFTLSSLFAGLCLRTKVDVVLTLSSPPLVNALVGWVVAKLKHAKSVHNVADIYPDMAEKAGIWNNGIVMALLKFVERIVYRLSDKIVVLSENMKRNLLFKNVDPTKIEIIPILIDLEKNFPAKKKNYFSRNYGLLDRTVVLYAGNIGIPHGVEILVESAVLMKKYEDIIFCIVGRGENKEKLIQLSIEKNLGNIRFLPRQSEELVPYMWASCDISVVTYKKGLGEYSLPSKLLYIMASQKPAVVVADTGSDASRLVQESGCGIVVEPNKPKKLKEALIYLKNNPLVRKEMGTNGYQYVKKHFEREVVTQKFDILFKDLTR